MNILKLTNQGALVSKMALKTIKRNSGFTIVELLIVIVVIAILATISIVAYNGIQSRAKSSAGQSTANSVLKKIEALNTIKGTYIDSAGGKTGANINTYANTAPTAAEAVLDKPASVIAATDASTPNLTSSTATNGTVVSAYLCSGGANVWYWDYAATSPAPVKLTAGAGC